MELIEHILEITKDEKHSRKALYEKLLSKGVLQPGEEDIFNVMVSNAIEKGILPTGRIKIYKKARGKLPTVFTMEQLQSIFESCTRPKLAVVMWLGLFCGLRIQEACHLKVDDINLERKKLFVRDSKNPLRGKQGYGKDRVVSIPHVAINPLKKWMNIIKGGDWFIPSMQDPNRPIRTKTIHEQYRFLLNRLGLSEEEYSVNYVQENYGKQKALKKNIYKYRFHTLRHTYATYLLDKGVPLENIQRSLGHKDLDTTLVYARISDKKTESYIDEAFDRPLRLVNKESCMNELQPRQPQVVNQTLNALSLNGESAMELLKKRLVMGEIDIVTYEHLSKLLYQSNSNA